MAGNVSIRLKVDGASEVKSALDGFASDTSAATAKVRSSLESLASGDVGGKLADQLTAAAVKVSAAQRALLEAPTGNATAMAAAQKSLTSATEAYNTVLERKRAQLVPAAAAEAVLAKSIADTDAAEKLGAVSTTEAATARQRAQTSYDQAIKSLKEVGTSSGAASASMRGLGIQTIQAFSGIATGQPVLTVLLQQGHQVVDQSLAMGTGFGGIATAAKGLVSAVGGLPTLLGVGVVGGLAALGAAAEHEADRLGNLRQQLRLTHADYVSLADAVDTAAKRVAASSTISTSDSRAGAQTIASAKYFSGTADDIANLTKLSADLAREWNVEIPAASARVRDALNDPAEAAKKFAAEGIPAFSGLNSGIVGVTESLERQGKVTEAQNIVLGALHQASAGATQDQSALSKALHDLEQRFYGARDGGKSLSDQMGSLIDKFAAHEVHGLDVFIEGLERMATKAGAAASAISNLANTRGGIVGADGMPLNLGTTSPTVSTESSAQAAPAVLTSSSTTKDAFVAEWMDAAKQAGSQLGVSPSILLAQWGNETGWGKSVYDNNAGNIKPGAGYTGQTYINPGDNQAYRAYPDPKTFADDFVAVVQQKWPDVKNTGANVSAYAAALHPGQQGGYAQDPNYAAKLIGTTATIGVTADQRRLADQLPSDVAGTRAIGSLGNADDLDRIHAQMAAVNKQLNDFAANGDLTSDAFKQAQAQGYGLLQKEQDLLAAERNRLDPQQQFLRGMQDQVAANAGLTEGDQRVLQLRQQMAEVERNQGGQFSPEQQAQAEAALSATQQQALARQIDGMRTATAGQDNLSAAYSEGYDAVSKTSAATSGYVASLTYGARGSDQQRAAATALTTEFERQASAANKVAVARATLQNKDQLTYIEAETQSLGMNDAARSAYLDHLKAEQYLLGQNISLTGAQGAAYLASVDKVSAASAALKGQEAALNELTGFVDSTFSTISDAIVSAFATGQQEAVKFKDVAASVVKAVEAEFLKLALINPLKNWIFGDDGKSPTLSSVGGIIGKLVGNDSGGTTAAIVGSAGVTGASSLVGALSNGGAGATVGGSGLTDSPLTTLGAAGTVAQLGDKLIGGSGTGGLVASIAGKITSAVTDALGNSAQAANIVANAGVTGNAATIAASLSNAVGFSDETASLISAATGKIADALPYVGAVISVVTDLAQGNYKGAGLVAGGALIGAYVGSIIPGVGTAIGTAVGAAVGGLLDAVLPSHPLHPYSNVDLNIAGGKLTTDGGYDVGQLTDLSADKAGVQAYADSINAYLQKVGVVITDADGTLGHIGAGITNFSRAGLTTGQTADASTLFKNLSFGGDPNDTSTFGIAKGALTGMSFSSPIDLQNELYKIAGFADAVDALGISLKSVGKDISNIQIASVSGANPDATSTVTDSSGLAINYHADLRTALNADLPTQTFADTTALDAEMQKVSDFVTGTLPSLLTPTKSVDSTLQDQIQVMNQKYADAAAQSRAYGLDNDQALLEADERAVQIMMKPAVDGVLATMAGINLRMANAVSGTSGNGAATIANLAATQNTERTQLEDAWRQVWGDGIVSNQAYIESMNNLIATQNAETQATQQQIAIAQAQGLAGLLATEAANAQSAGINGLGASLAAFDSKAADQRLEFIKAWTDYYGQASAGSQELQDQLLIMDKATAVQRLAVQQDYSDASIAALKTAQGSVTSLFTSIKDYALKLETGSQSALSPLDQYDLAKNQFNAVSGAAAAGDAASASELTTYADALLTASQAVNGSGAAYADDYSKVLDVLQSVTSNVDGLTQSFMAQQTDNVVSAVTAVQTAVVDVKSEIAALRREMQQQTRAQGS